MTMKNTLLLMVLSSVLLQASWAADKTATGGEAVLLPPPPPGPFMSAEGSMPGNEAGTQQSAPQEGGLGEMPAIEPMTQDWPKDDFPAMSEMPPPPEFPAWNEQGMPPMPKDMGKYPAMGEMPPPPEFPEWNERRMPPMPEFNPPANRAFGARPPMRPRYQRPEFMPRGYPVAPQGYRKSGRPGPTPGASSHAE